jgi:hypothetical protein
LHLQGKGKTVSFKPQVVADNSGEWVSNGLCFATQAEAEAYVSDLMWRWTLVRDTRVIVSSDPVTVRWENGRTIHLREEVKDAERTNPTDAG